MFERLCGSIKGKSKARLEIVCVSIVKMLNKILIGIRTPLLIRFSRIGNMVMIRLLLKLGCDPNKIFLDETPIKVVINSRMSTSKKVCALELLLKEGANVNNSSELWTPLFEACRVGCDLKVVKLLVEHGANVNQIDKNGESALLLICKKANPDLDIVKFLVESGADINYTDKHSNNCLKYACENNNYSVAKYFIYKGAKFGYNNISALFGSMTELEPRMLCAIHNWDVSQLTKLTEDYLKENMSGTGDNYMNKTEISDFRSILRKRLLPMIRKKKEMLDDEILRQGGYNENHNNGIISHIKEDFVNVCDIEGLVCGFIHTVSIRLDDDISQEHVNNDKIEGLERVSNNQGRKNSRYII